MSRAPTHRAPSTLHALPATVMALALAQGCPSGGARAQSRPDQPATTPGTPTQQPGPAADPALASRLEAARALAAQGDHAGAVSAFEAALPAGARTPGVSAGLLGLARSAQALGDRPRARAALERVALDFPADPAAREAKLMLAGMDLEEGRTQEGVSAMRGALAELPEKERIPYARSMGLALVASGQHAAAVLPLSSAEAATTDAAQRAELQVTLLDVVDRHLRPTEMLGLRESLPEGTYARNILTLKLARLWVHLGDEPRARDELKAFVDAAPQDPLAANARDLLKVLDERSLVATRRLGIILPTSGKYAQAGERVLAALKLGLQSAAQEAATATGKPVEPVEVVVVDDQGGTDEAARAVDGLVAEHKVMAVAGPLNPGGASAAAVRAEALKVPLLAMARREGLAEMGPYTFSLTLTDERQAREVARIAATQLGFKRVALLYPRLPRGVALTNAFWDEFEARGGAIAGVEGYDHDETTFAAPVRKLVGRHFMEARYEHIMCMAEARKVEQDYKRQKAMEACADVVKPVVDFDAVFIADWHKPVGLIAPAFAFEDVFVGNDERALRKYKDTMGAQRVKKVLLLGTNGFNDKTLPQRGGTYVQGAVFVDGFNASDGRPETQAFVKAFVAETKARPDLREAQAYDAGRALGMVFAQNPQSRAAFREALARIKDHPGVTGPITADEQGSMLAPLHVFTIKNNAIVPAVLDAPTGG